MSIYDLIYYVMDAVIIGMLAGWLRNSSRVKIETKVPMKWLVPLIFVAVSVVCAINYTGIFAIVQVAAMLLCAVLYFLQKSGLSEEGIVNMGALTKYSKAGKVHVDRKESCISFKYGRKTGILYFDPSQMDEVRKFLAEKSKEMQ